MNFIKNIISSFIGSLLAIVIGSVLVIALLVGAIAMLVSDAESKSEVEYGTTNFLEISLSKPISEYAEALPFEDMDLPYGVGTTGKQGLVQLLAAIDQAATDDQIKGLYLNISGIYAGYAQVKEVRDRIIQFKTTSSKPVIAYSEMLTEKGYYLASVADEVYLTPEGILEFNGLSAEVMYYKNLFEKLEVKPKIFKVGKYKSAVEPFFRENMSEANREQTRAFIESLYQSVMLEIAESRKINPIQLRSISDNLLVRNVYEAVDQKLIDGAWYYDQVIARMKERVEISLEDKITFIPIGKYQANAPESKGDKIGVVIADGEIYSGKSSDGVIGSSSFIKSLREAKEDEEVKAIVIRINSPGGSALASDIMWREIKAAAQVKPVIASMSSVAASGGYYMAMACDHIVAEPTTITGSIGVFGVLFTLEDFLENKIGITTDRVNTGPYADLGSVTRSITDADSMVIQKEVERIYDVFTKKAAEGRKMEQSKLQEYAGGRVWTGVEALSIGLVDTLGGLDAAIALAASKSSLDNFGVAYFTGEKSFWEKVSGDKSTLEEKVLKEKLGENYSAFKTLEALDRKRGVQAIMPFELDVQ